MTFKYLLCDLDNTLYSEASGMLNHIDGRIDSFIEQKLSLAKDEIAKLRNDYWRKYGTTLSGLMIHHQIKPDEYIQFAYAINVAEFLKSDPILANILNRIELPKAIFSNSPREYIQKVLEVLGLESCFSKIYDIRFCHYAGKPNLSSYRSVIEDLGIEPEECILIDDNLANIQAAEKIGIIPVYLNRDPQHSTKWEIHEIYDLGEIVRELIQGKISA